MCRINNFELDATIHNSRCDTISSFGCDNCGLSLEDSEEIRLAGIDTNYDRTDEIDNYPFDDPGDY